MNKQIFSLFTLCFSFAFLFSPKAEILSNYNEKEEQEEIIEQNNLDEIYDQNKKEILIDSKEQEEKKEKPNDINPLNQEFLKNIDFNNLDNFMSNLAQEPDLFKQFENSNDREIDLVSGFSKEIYPQYLEAEKEYQDLISCISIKKTIKQISDSVKDVFESIKPELDESLIENHNKFISAIDNGDLFLLINVLFKTENSQENKKLAYDINEIAAFQKSLESFLDNKQTLDDNAKNKVIKLKTVIESIISNNFYLLTQEIMSVVYPKIETTIISLKKTIAIFTEIANSDDANKYSTEHHCYDIDPETAKEYNLETEEIKFSEVLQQWIDILKDYTKTIETFVSMQKNMSSHDSVSNKNHYIFFALLERIYDFSNEIYKLYKKDNPQVTPICLYFARVSPKILDFSFRSLVSLLFFYKEKQSINKDNIFNILFEKTSLTNINGINYISSHMYLVFYLGLWMTGYPNFIFNNFDVLGGHFIYKSFRKLFTTFIYYKFKRSIGKQSNFEKLGQLKYDTNFKNAIFDIFKNITSTIGLSFQRGLEKSIGQKTVKSIEEKTLGIIHPSILNVLFKSFIPIIALKYSPENIAKFNESDVFGIEFTTKTKKMLTDKDIKDYPVAACYVEKQVLEHILFNFGFFGGKKLCQKHNDKIINAFSYIFDGTLTSLNKVGLLSEETMITVKLFKNQFKMMKKAVFLSLKNIFHVCLSPGPMRDLMEFIIFMNKTIPLKKECEKVSDRTIISFLLNILCDSKLLLPTDSLKILTTYDEKINKKKDNHLDIVSRLLAQIIQENFISSMGGILSGYLTKEATIKFINDGFGSIKGHQIGGFGPIGAKLKSLAS